MLKKIFCFLLVFSFALSLCACGKIVPWSANSFDVNAKSEKCLKKVIAENENYTLEWTTATACISLVEKKTGTRFGITPYKEGEPTVDEYGMPIKKKPILQSALIVKYVNENSFALESAFSYTDSVANGKIKATPIKNGIAVEYYFDSIKVMVPVEYTLRDNSVAISIDPTKIQEEENKVASVSVAPYWCSTENLSDNAYLFVPSGSGALVGTNEISQSGAIYSASVYGRDQVMTMNDYLAPEKSVRLPVFGAKQGDKATFAVIENASESCEISVNAGNTNIGYSTVYATFQVRGSNESFISGNLADHDVYASSMVKTPLTVGYYILSGDDADYSGMANIYKDYLKKENLLKENKNDNILGVTIIGGKLVNRSFLGIPYKTVLSATTLKEAKKILKDISSKTDKKISAKLIGFGSSGINLGSYCGGFKINSALGSKKDLKALNEFANDNNIDLYFDFDLVKLKNSSSGFSTLFDVSRNACYKITDLYDYSVSSRSRISSSKYNLLSRKYLFDGMEKLINKTKSWSLSGISLETLTSLSYSDYSDKKDTKYYSKANFSNDVSKLLKSAKEKYKIASYDANAYSAYNSDVIFSASTVSSKENIFYADVPFYEIVFKGYVPMISEPLNLSADIDDNKLRAIESGIATGYVITNSYDNEFADSDSYYFFGSKYSDLKNVIDANIKELKDYYSAVENQKITKHTILDNGLRLTEFSGKTRVYVNFTDKTLNTPLGEVKPYGFVWGRE